MKTFRVRRYSRRARQLCFWQGGHCRGGKFAFACIDSTHAKTPLVSCVPSRHNSKKVTGNRSLKKESERQKDTDNKIDLTFCLCGASTAKTQCPDIEFQPGIACPTQNICNCMGRHCGSNSTKTKQHSDFSFNLHRNITSRDTLVDQIAHVSRPKILGQAVILAFSFK